MKLYLGTHMKYYVYHWMGKELEVPGVYQEGEPERHTQRPPHWIDIPDDQLGEKLKELAESWDVMFLSPIKSDTYFRIYLDQKGGRFRQR